MKSKEIVIIEKRIKELESAVNDIQLKLNQILEVRKSLEIEYLRTKGSLDEYYNMLKILNEEVCDDSENPIEEESVNIKKSNSRDTE